MDALHKKLMHLESGILVEALSGFGGQNERIANNAEFDMLAFIISSSVRGVRREFIEHNDPHDPKAASRLLSDMIAKWLQL